MLVLLSSVQKVTFSYIFKFRGIDKPKGNLTKKIYGLYIYIYIYIIYYLLFALLHHLLAHSFKILYFAHVGRNVTENNEQKKREKHMSTGFASLNVDGLVFKQTTAYCTMKCVWKEGMVLQVNYFLLTESPSLNYNSIGVSLY